MAWCGLLNWAAKPHLGGLRRAGVGPGLGMQAVVAGAAAAAVAAAGSQTGTAGALMMAVGGADVAAVEHKLEGKDQVR